MKKLENFQIERFHGVLKTPTYTFYLLQLFLVDERLSDVWLQNHFPNAILEKIVLNN